MSLWSRIANLFRLDGLSTEIAEELRAHIEEAVEQGRDPAEARRAFGSALRIRDETRDIRLIPWLDALRADAVFGWRQLMKRKVTSAAAILSLALAIGACTSAFRLIDALLLRPLPIAQPERLYALVREGVSPEGTLRISDSYEYPLFREMRAAVRDQVELLAISYANRTDLTFGTDQEMEKVHLQYVSGSTFDSLGIRPALGRLFTEDDDREPGAHPHAVLSHDFWTSRFGQDPQVIGRTFRIGNDLFQIVGVAAERFTGTEPGTVTGIFLPNMMNPGVPHDDWSWLRIYARLKPGVTAELVRERLRVPFRTFREGRVPQMAGLPKVRIERYLGERLLLEPAAAGLSDMQKDYSRSLAAIGVLVALVLLIACANVANLMAAQAAARAREMALRVSIGAGRWRLVQLVLVESAWLAMLSALIGGLFSWWSAPFIVSRINPPDNPARLVLPADWRVLGFTLVLTLGVTLLFGLIPALRASAVSPASALKGGAGPRARRRLMHALIAAQVAFCFLVHFVAGLFVATFHRLSNQATGFSAERVLTLQVVARTPQSAASWDQLAEHLRSTPGIEAVALAAWPLLSGNGMYGAVSVNGAPPGNLLPYFLRISPGLAGLLKIPFLDGRDFRPGETHLGVAIVNQTFANEYFHGQNPVGKWFEALHGRRLIVGLIGDTRYRNMREPILPIAFLPFDTAASGTVIVRTSSANPLSLASTLRREVQQARPEFRVSNIRTQTELNQQHTVRERLLATLGLFFAVVALLLAGVGLYGVLDYSVLQRRREIGIRIAIGAHAGHIARGVTAEVFSMVLAGAIIGVGLGMASVRYIHLLLYDVKPAALPMLALPAAVILLAALLASLPPVIRAVRIDPATMLRAD